MAQLYNNQIQKAKTLKVRVKGKYAKQLKQMAHSTMLECKCDHTDMVFKAVSEAYSTETCSCCGTTPDSSPKGRAGLRIREWPCSECGAEHHREINAAKNILAVGHRRLAVGVLAL